MIDDKEKNVVTLQLLRYFSILRPHCADQI